MDSDTPYNPRQTSYRQPARRRRRRRYHGSPLISMLFFPCALIYHELLLRVFDKDIPFFGAALLRIVLFSAAAGLLVFFILDIIPNKKISRCAGGILIFIFIVILCVERGMRTGFSIYYGILSASKTAGGAMEDFSGGIFEIVLAILPFILLSLIPLVLFILMRRTVIYERGQQWLARIFIVFFAIIAQLFGYMFSNIGDARADYTTDFDANSGIRSFGLLTTVRLDLKYGIFGQPETDVGSFVEDGPSAGASNASDPSGSDAPSGSDPTDPSDSSGTTAPTEPIVYGYNTLDIDFDALAAGASNNTIKSMHEYFGSLTPTQKNEYTGMFKDKNLILLTAESFSPYVIDEELTPTLYRLTHEGFVFNHFYQPDWSQSTCGGEFSVTTGVIPNWVNGDIAARESINNSMPTTLGNMFRAIGYSTPAWHNGSYDYYSRDKYLATFGYDFKAENGGGFDLEFDGWPRSDLEMIEKTCDEYINAYVQTGQKFHAYYMTISGHGNWYWAKNNQSQKYRSLVEQKYPDLSEPCQSYIACNIDLDRGLEYLVRKLEAAGIADDTLIVMAADHYPYFLANGNNHWNGSDDDYYNELTQALIGETDSEAVTSRYRNTLLMWSGCIETPIVVDTPCSSIDIVPTVANLFGLEYDSRLYSGRDIFATNYAANEYSSSIPLVIFADTLPMKGNSWITPAGTYESSTKTFTPAPGVTLADQDDYVSRVKRLVSGKIQNAKLIVSQNYYAKVFD